MPLSALHPMSTDPVRASQEPPLPVLLVLDSMMSCGPWPLAVARSSSTLQISQAVDAAKCPSIRGSIEYAALCQGIEHVIVCGEGRGEPSGASLERMLETASAIADHLSKMGAFFEKIAIEVLWHDTSTGELLSSSHLGHANALSSTDTIWNPRLTEKLRAFDSASVQ